MMDEWPWKQQGLKEKATCFVRYSVKNARRIDLLSCLVSVTPKQDNTVCRRIAKKIKRKGRKKTETIGTAGFKWQIEGGRAWLEKKDVGARKLWNEAERLGEKDRQNVDQKMKYSQQEKQIKKKSWCWANTHFLHLSTSDILPQWLNLFSNALGFFLSEQFFLYSVGGKKVGEKKE